MQWWSLKRLKSASARARLSAVQKLGHEGDLSLVHPLTEILADDSAEVRTAAAQALGRIQSEQVIAPLSARLRLDPEPEVRLAIVTSLHALQSPDAVPSLVEALADGSGEVGWKAAQALKLLKWEPSDDVERASFLLATTRFEDVIALGQSAIGPLIKIAQGTTYQRSIRAVEALSIVGGAQAVRPLLECLECADFTVRSAAATALGEVGDGRALDPLIKALQDSYHQVCLAACISLGKLADERAVEPVMAVLQHQAPDVRTAAVETLGKLRDRRSVPGLVQALSDSDNIVRESAAIALGFIRDEAAIEHLVIALTDSQPTIRQAANTALSRIQPHWQETEAAARAIPALQAALKSKDYWIRHSAADVLKKFGIGCESETALFTDSDGARRKRVAMQTVLSSMLEDSDRAFRQAAAETFGRIGLAESIPILVNRLTDQDRGVKRAAARSLDVLRWQTDVRLNRARQLVALERWSEAVALGDEAIEPLVESFLWNDPGVRRRASEALVHIGGSQAAAALQSLSASSVPAIREEAATALGALNSTSTRKRSI